MNHGKIMATGKPEMIGVQGEDGTRRAGYSRRARPHPQALSPGKNGAAIQIASREFTTCRRIAGAR